MARWHPPWHAIAGNVANPLGITGYPARLTPTICISRNRTDCAGINPRPRRNADFAPFSRKHDTILCYAKSRESIFNIDAVRQPYKPTSGFAKSGITAKSGKIYRPNPLGTPIDDVWDIPIINPMAAERIGYPTQKPLVLLERIIAASCPEGGLVLDPFCGGGTSCVAAERLGRAWIGIDISPHSAPLLKQRLRAINPAFQDNWMTVQTQP